jgi:ABC-type branched-subunit amino acid transport system substrate-binding protein
MRRTRWRWLAVLMVVIGLVAAGCGGGGRGDDTSSPSSTSTDPGESGPSGGFGDLPSPCGGTNEGNTGGDQGVTADKIVIGYGDDAGFPQSPGLNKEMSEAVRGLIEWCNDQGGINGRTIEGKYYDAKITEANNAITQACAEVFMMVGNGFALDGGAEQTRVSCGLPQVPGYTVSATVAHGPNTYLAVPNPVDFTPTGQADLLAKKHPEQVKKAAVVYGDFPATIETTQKVLDTYPQWGWEFISDCAQTYPLVGTVQWAPYVQKLKDCGAEFVYFAGSPLPNFQNFLDAAAQANYKPLWLTDSNFYAQDFANANASGNANNTYMRLAFTPFEQAGSNKATQQYVELAESQGGRPALLGAQSASAFLLWATAVKECGANVTRQCVLDELGKITEWTGGGLHAKTNPAENLPPDCVMVLQMQNTEYKQVLPEEQGTFACDPKYASKVSPSVEAVAAAKLNADRVSTVYTGG